MRKITIILSLFVFFTLRGGSTGMSFYFSSLNLKNGLSQLSVFKIYQDNEGFMWFATRNGLNCYDGTTMKVYKYTSDKPNSLPHNHIKAIKEDRRGQLWIGTIGGICRLDKRTDRIITYHGNSFEGLEPQYMIWVNDLFADKEDRLWVASQSGLYFYQPQTDTFKRFNPAELNGVSYFTIINQDRQGNLLFGTNNGFFIFTGDLRFVKRYSEGDTEVSLTNKFISAIYESGPGCYWVGTREHGLNKVDHGKGIVKQFTGLTTSLKNDHIRDITYYDGRIVAGSEDGLILIDPETDKIDRYTNYDEKKGGLSHFSVYSLFVDRNQTLWVGTYSGGVNYFNPLNNRFRRLAPKESPGVFFGIFGAMDYQKDHTLWIASEGGGLLEFDLRTRQFSNYLLETGGKVMNDNIIKSVKVEGDTVWCGTQRGTIYTFDTKTRRFSLFYNYERIISIYQIERTLDGSIWTATTDNRGFVQFTPEGKRVGMIETDVTITSVRCFRELRENVFLLGTHMGGLVLYDKKTGTLVRYTPAQAPPNYFPSEHITGIVPDLQGKYWIATYGGGVCLFDEKAGVVEHYTVKDGLSDDNICALVRNGNGHLWMSTLQGISSFDPETRQFTNYTDRNEIGTSEFNILGGVCLPDDDIYFSGSEDILFFNPEKLPRNKEIPPVVFTNLVVNNEKVYAGEDSPVLKENINHIPEIVLKANENNFSIGYMGLNYLFPYQNQYAYMLERYDKEWNYVGNRNEAFYTNLKPGKYIFRVKASNNDGVWNEEGRSVRIRILSPLWLTPLVIFFYILIVLSIVYSFYYYLHKKRQLERDLQEKQREQERQEEFHQSKIRLFTNFSHELRTPLTLILSPLEDILQRVELGGQMKESLRQIHNNAQRLLLLVNQLMDLQKNQVGNLQLRVSYNNLYLFIEEMFVAFNQIAERNRIGFRMESSAIRIDGWFDRSLLEKVVFNLLSNAFKHTKAGESVTITLEAVNKDDLQALLPKDKFPEMKNKGDAFVCIAVEDTGEGINEEDKQHIFSPFYQGSNDTKNDVTGTGIGLSLVLSIVKLHQGVIWLEDYQPKGSIFRLIIPVGKEVYTQEQILMEKQSVQMLSDKGEAEEVTGWKPLKQRYLILLAEDNAEVREYVKRRLEPYFDVQEADNGVSAYKKVTDGLPDLVISDVMMPQMDGLTLCSKIKQDIRTSHIPVIMMTARSMLIHIKEGFRSGADDYIIKPFNMEVLLFRIRAILEARERLRELYGKKFSLESLGIETSSVDDSFMRKFFPVLVVGSPKIKTQRVQQAFSVLETV